MEKVMAHDSSLDPYIILKTLGVQTIRAVVPILSGTDTALWRVEHDNNTSALRVFRSTQRSTYLREIDAMETAARHGIPVPRIRANGYWQERPALLLSWCDGHPLAASLQQQPWRLLHLAHTFGQVQAAIHRIRGIALLDTAPTDWITWYQAVDRDLEAQLRQCASPTPHLLHLDYHPLNVMTHGSSVSGVLDWANARMGDPRADVARTYTILVVEPHHVGREPRWYRAVRSLVAHRWLAGYQAVAGELQNMPIFYAWAGAVMRADLAPRVHNPTSWWQPQHLEIVERWTQQWRKRVASARA
jgi:aminoglycoside phosphotransferase (APT) family kinase protein